MQLYLNLTSPYGRIVRVALHEKGLSAQVNLHIVDPWADEPELLQVNPLGRVPALVTSEGETITESLAIVFYLEESYPEPALAPVDRLSVVLGQAGLAVGILDQAVQTLVGRRILGPEFDGSPVGRRRRRGMTEGVARLERNPPAEPGKALDLGAIATATALDYLAFRFPETDWLAGHPRLAAWRESLVERQSLVETMPPGT